VDRAFGASALANEARRCGSQTFGPCRVNPATLGIDARQANQHSAIADVVVRHVVNIGVRSEQLGAIIEIHANGKRARFGRAMSGDTRQEFPWILSAGHPYAVLSSTPGKASPIFRTMSKSIVFLRNLVRAIPWDPLFFFGSV